MKLVLACALVGLFMAAEVQAGNITGMVHAEPKAGTEPQEGDSDHYASRKFKFAPRVDYAALHDFVVYLEGPVGDKPTPPEKPLVVETRHSVSQKGAVFVPHVLPVVVGTKVEWPNNDEIYHNVFSMSAAKTFDLDLYKAPAVKSVTFDKPGRVDVFCSIHANMNCVVLVLENPYFAATDLRGHYAITNVPPGKYNLVAWHERVPRQVAAITVLETGGVQADFTLGFPGSATVKPN